jgi:hypothetical protein
MSNEKKMEKKEDVQNAPTEQEENKEDVQPAPVEQSEESKPEVDYVAELGIAKSKLEKAGNTIEKIKKENKELKNDDDDDDEYIDYQEEINKQVAKKMDSVRADLSEDTIESTLEDLTVNVDERALIKHHYDNSLQKTGFSRQAIMQDLLNAKLLANRKTLSKENSELKAALSAKESTGNSSRGANLDKANIDKPMKPISDMSRDEHKAYWESFKK